MKINSLVQFLLFSMLAGTLACSPEKNGSHERAPTASDLQKASAELEIEYTPGPEHALLEKSFVSGEVTREETEDGYNVTVVLNFDPVFESLPEGHDGTITVTTSNDGQSAVDAQVDKMEDHIEGKILCKHDCQWVAVLVIVDDEGTERMAGFGFDVVANRILWQTPEGPE